MPLPGSDTIYACPSAELPTRPPDGDEAPFDIGDGSGLKFYFNYVPNSKLENGTPGRWDGINGAERITLYQMPAASNTILMVELRSTRRELPFRNGQYRNPDGSANSNGSDRAKADWKRIANRHSDTNNMTFGDGHAAGIRTDYAYEQLASDYINPAIAGRNKSDLIWSPLTAADGP